MTQKFFKGDLVQLGDMPNYMRHFRGNCQAIVMYTYKERYGGTARDETKYSLCLLPAGTDSSWYDEDLLTFIEPDRFDLLPASNYDRKVYEAKQQRDNKGE